LQLIGSQKGAKYTWPEDVTDLTAREVCLLVVGAHIDLGTDVAAKEDLLRTECQRMWAGVQYFQAEIRGVE
jgi:hypothetical protein